MANYRLYCLGRPLLEKSGKPVKLEMRKSLALVAYLRMADHDYSREFLSGLFWPDYDQQHALATIVFIGYYLFTSLIYLPVFERQMQANALRDLLEHVSARLRPFFGGSLLIFLVTGTHLMLINKNYPGLGNFFANPWSILIVIKHVLVVTFLALAVYSERSFLGQISDEKPEALKQYRWALNINTIQGMVILLLISIAQTS